MELKENFSSVFWGKKEEIFEKIESSHGCFLCNPEIYENFHSSNENISNHFLKKHFKFAVEFEVKGRKGFSLPCRKQECLDRKSETEARRSHFHCPFCTHVFGRSRPLKHHLVTKNGECGSIKSSSDKQLPSTSTDRICNQEVHRKGFMCKICSQCFSSTIALRRHGEKKHDVLQSILPCVTIDAVNGIFMVAISSKGPLAPIHVKKNVLQSASVCTSEECMYLIKHLSIMNPGYECQHLLAVQYSQIAETVFLQQFYLNELRRLNSISDNSCQKCLQLQEASLQAHVPLLVYVDFESLGYSGRMKYFSVLCEEESYFSPLCRVRVTFDYDKSQFFCQCPIAKGDNVFCVHQNIAKWYMCQYQREWLEASEPVRYYECCLKIKSYFNMGNIVTCLCEYKSNLQMVTLIKSLVEQHGTVQRNTLLPFDVAMMAYFLEEKRIPTNLPHYILDDAAPPKLLMPSEKNCPICKGVAFTEKSKKVTVYGMGRLWHDIMLVTKKCMSCQGLIRFQNYQSGFHNFDNTFLLTVKLCSYLIRGIESKKYVFCISLPGGIVHFRCPHGICVYFKYIARQESARDYIDGLLSLKRQPVVFISDISSQVAHHGENRQPGMFRPYKGMLYEWTSENLKLQKEGTLPLASVELSNNNGSKFYSLSDRFHARAKKKSPEESFRNLKNCSNLKEINTSIYFTLWFHKGRFTSRNNDWAIDVTNAEVFIYDPLGREKTIAPTITTNLTWYTVDIWDFNVPNSESIRTFVLSQTNFNVCNIITPSIASIASSFTFCLHRFLLCLYLKNQIGRVSYFGHFDTFSIPFCTTKIQKLSTCICCWLVATTVGVADLHF
ncbi:uncharacterized protein LOC143463382 [Clavelina lepadiformis]|uniref:uncharacterized protein LOC143463382 n=1 Tax=Clavelina lepadiformis TaxID=159417 RepID=UPI0040418348